MTRRTSDAATGRFAERLSSLSDASFAEFCARLWVARGYTVERSGNRLFVEREREERTLLVWSPPGVRGRIAGWMRGSTAGEHRGGDGGVDVVLTPSGRDEAERVAERYGARLVGPAALSDLLRYGVDREAADSLSTRFFGVETAELVSGGEGHLVGRDETSTGRTAAVAVGAACCLVAAAVLAGVWVPGSGPVAVDDTAPPLLTGAGVEPRSDAANDSAGGLAAGSASFAPPGVGEATVDADALAAAHAAAVSNASYRLIVRQSGTDAIGSERHWRGVWQHAVVEDERTWLYSVVGYEHHGNDSRLVQYTAYADGDTVYQRGDTRDGAVYNRSLAHDGQPDGAGVHTERASEYVRRYLATTEVAIDRPTWRPESYRLVATGRPTAIEGRVSNYTATALVSSDGFVSELTVEYTRHEAGETRQVTFRMEYAAVNETQVRPPGWLTEARNETGTSGGTNATVDGTGSGEAMNGTEASAGTNATTTDG